MRTTKEDQKKKYGESYAKVRKLFEFKGDTVEEIEQLLRLRAIVSKYSTLVCADWYAKPRNFLRWVEREMARLEVTDFSMCQIRRKVVEKGFSSKNCELIIKKKKDAVATSDD